MKHAIAILTFSPTPEYDGRLRETMNTLVYSGYPGKIFIVDDGSYKERSFALFKDIATIVKKPENVGVARGKNTSIRLLMDYGVDIGFLSDDDVNYGEAWWQDYAYVHEHSDIQHLSWCRRDGKRQPHEKTYYGVRLCQSNYLNGLMITFTPKAIEIVGGMWATPLMWGWDHVNWTNRMVASKMCPYYCDVVRPELWLAGGASPIKMVQRQECRKYNYDRLGDLWRPLEE